MDRKSIIILAVSVVLLVLWYPLVINKIFPPKPLPKGATNTLARLVVSNETSTATSAVPVMQGATTNRPTLIPVVEATGPETLLEISNSLAHYTFTSRGGGLKEVELLRYPETTTTRREKHAKPRGVASLNTHSPLPSLAIVSGDLLNGQGEYRLTRTADGVRAERSLTNGLTLIKEFSLSTNYLVLANVRFENHSSNTITLPPQDWIVGTATPMGIDDNGQNVGVSWYNGAKSQDILGATYFSSSGFMCTPKVPPLEYRGGAGDVVWAAAHNQFFTMAAMPQQPAQSVVIQRLDLPRPVLMEGQQPANKSGAAPQGYVTSLVFPGTNIAPSQVVGRQIAVFAGPKEYQTLARLGGTFNNNIDLVMGYGGFFGFFAKALLVAMNTLHNVFKLPYGWAIIGITIIIKVVFWPLTAASTRSMKRMQALQPQMKAIQEKYKDDPVKMNKKTMEFMKEHKVSPLGGCLPMLLQIPVFFGFYRMIQSAIELRGAPFLWVGDLSKPDTLFFIPGTGFPFNLLPLLMGVTMLWQAKLTPPSPGMDPAQAKIMRYMPLMFMVFLYNFSAGLTLYWTVQNLLTIAQTKLTKNISEPGAAPQAPVLTRPVKKR